MIHRLNRFLLLWFFVVLQAIAPFIHAHAGTVQLNHAGFLHLHQGAPHADAAWHATAADDHGAEVAVETGLPLRHFTPGAPAEAPLAAALPRIETERRSVAGLPAPPLLRFALPDHTLPPALAPPAL